MICLAQEVVSDNMSTAFIDTGMLIKVVTILSHHWRPNGDQFWGQMVTIWRPISRQMVITYRFAKLFEETMICFINSEIKIHNADIEHVNKRFLKSNRKDNKCDLRQHFNNCDALDGKYYLDLHKIT